MITAPYLVKPTRISGVIFDCDGVMLDSRAANELYYNKILEFLGLPPLTPEQEAYTFMATVHQSLDYITPPHLRDKLPEICKKVVNYQRDIMPHVRLEEGFLEFVQWLQAHGVRMAVHTNRYSGMPAILDTFQLHEFFDPVITAAVVSPKPDPEGVFRVLKVWNARPDELLFVGDSPNDQQTAAAAHVPFAAYRNPALDAAVKVGTFRELADTLRSIPLTGDGVWS